MIFRNYQSAFEEFRAETKKQMALNRVGKSVVDQTLGFDSADHRSYYKWEIAATKTNNQIMAGSRFLTELLWYESRRPFFNVYPLIERKFLELSESIDMSELVMPFPAIEVRTNHRTILLGDFGREFMITVELRNGYQEIRVPRTERLGVRASSRCQRVAENWQNKGEEEISKNELSDLIYLAAGVCMLANDSSIVKPVILNQHRRENMTPNDIARYAEKAVNRTGRIGFEVGRDIERMKATAHYRNGCFAKYYVGKDHECYPPKAEASLVPIIKWRCGAVVNKDNVPKVPTGFHDVPDNRIKVDEVAYGEARQFARKAADEIRSGMVDDDREIELLSEVLKKVQDAHEWIE